MERTIFVSSTVYDLGRERAAVRALIEECARRTGLRLHCSMSEYPDFRMTPRQLSGKHSFDICLDNVRAADYIIVLLKKRYSTPVVLHNGEHISITHREYREAYYLGLPIFTFVHQKTWRAKHRAARGLPQAFIPPRHVRVFNFIDEMRTKPRNNWIEMYGDIGGLNTALITRLLSFDDSGFVGDVTIPDGHTVEVSETFEKVWEIENRGFVVWENRLLREESTGSSGLIAKAASIRIPRVMPGQRVRLRMQFTAPRLPASCVSEWKMLDAHGCYCFPHINGLTCKVAVVERRKSALTHGHQRS